MTTRSRAAGTHTNTNPGLEFFVWPKAYEHAAQTAVDKVFEEEALTNAYRSHIQSNDVEVTQVVKPTLRIEIRGSKLIWMVDNASVTVRGQRRHQNGEETFEKRISGSLEVSIAIARDAPFFEPIYSAKVNSENMTSSDSSHGNVGADFNVFDICNENASNSVDDLCNYASISIDYYSGSRKRTSSEDDFVFQSAGNIIIDELCCPSTKRIRNDVPINGGNDSINSMIGRASENDLGETLVGAFSKAVLDSLNDRLPDYAFPVGSSSGNWLFDFSGMATPRFQNGYLWMTHLGAFHYNNIPMTMQVQQTRPFPEPQNLGSMLTIFISNYVFKSIGYCFHECSILSYDLTQADLIAPETTDNSAKNNCRRTRCNSATNNYGRTRYLSDCFPDFSQKYPGAWIEVKMASSEAPTAKFSGQSLKVTMTGSAIFRAHRPYGYRVNFLTTKVSMETTVLLKLNLKKLVGTGTSIVSTSLTVVESALETVNSEVLQEVFDLIASQFLSRKFEEIAENGIPLPRPLLSGVEEFENAVLSEATDDYLRIDADLKFHA